MQFGRTCSRPRRPLRPWSEWIESRSLLSGYSPTAIEQYDLELLDDARFNPAAYGASLGIDLSGVAPAQPLAMNTLLVEAARLHSQDMIDQGYFSHISPQGSDPGDRIQATGFDMTGFAESIETDTNSALASTGFAANYATWEAGYSLSSLIVDNGVPDLGHRVMLLDIGGLDRSMRQVGIGLASQETTSGEFDLLRSDTTIDLASTPDGDPFLTGVVFDDAAGNGEYEPGKGLGGVTIAVAGVGATTTLDAGGYSIQLAPGTYTVTASGGGLPAPITRTVVLGDDNARLNFDEDPNGATLDAAPDGTASGLLGSFTAFDPGDTAASYSARIDWGDGNASFATLTPEPDGTFAVDGSNAYAAPGVYAVRVLVTHLSDGQTLALNATVVVDSSTYSGPSFPNPAYAGEVSLAPAPASGGSGQSSSGTGTATDTVPGSHHDRKKHPAPRSKPAHPAHAPVRHKAPKRAAQGVRNLLHPDAE